MTVSPGLLQDALEGHSIAGPDRAEVAALVGLAARVRRLQPEGPSSLAMARMTARFETTIQQPRRGRLFLLLAPWLGLGERPRPLFQRLAAGALLFASVGGGASVAGGLDPAATAGNVANFITNAVTNLLPRDDSGGLAVPSPTNTPPAPAGATAAPSETPTPGATPTPEPPPVASPPPAGSGPTFQGPLLPVGPALPPASTRTPATQSEAVPPPPFSPTATPTTTSATVPPSTTDVPLPSPTAAATPQPPSPTATSTPPQSPPTATSTPQPPSPTPTVTETPSSDHDGPSPTASPTATETPRPDGRKVDP